MIVLNTNFTKFPNDIEVYLQDRVTSKEVFVLHSFHSSNYFPLVSGTATSLVFEKIQICV